MPNIDRVELPAAADGSPQWFTVVRRPTHGQAKAIAAAFYERLNGPDVLGIQTVVVRTLVPQAVVKDVDWGTDGEGIENCPQDIVTRMYEEAEKAVEDLFPDPSGNRAGRRQKR